MLREYEWKFMVQLVSRLYCCGDYAALCATLFQQLRTLVPFDLGVCFRTRREGGRALLSDPVSSRPEQALSWFLEGDYPRWAEFIMAPHSSIFQQSDLVSPGLWESSRVYQEIWAPQNIYWGLFLAAVRQDEPQALLGFFRSREGGDFDKRDTYVLEVLREPLENCLHRLDGRADRRAQDLRLRASGLGLTPREAEVAALVGAGMDTGPICDTLHIAPSTLNKHLANIFAKLRVNSRAQLRTRLTLPAAPGGAHGQ